VKAAFLEKFGKFVLWPNNAFADANAPLVIGVFEDNGNALAGRESSRAAAALFYGVLENLAARDTINGHPVHVVQIKAMSDLKNCHIIFIPASMKSQEHEILDVLKAANGGPPQGAPASILTVSDSDDFCAAGGMIQFIIEDQQVHFQIKNETARAAGLKISSKLLTLAKQAER
jgi:hypothetical protein